jgi:uncharacterized OsmC-like protein
MDCRVKSGNDRIGHRNLLSGASRTEGVMPQQAIREAIDNVAKSIAANPAKGLVRNSPATASLTRDLSFSISGPKGEKAQTDMPEGLGGGGGVPQPGWLMRASLASCTGTVIAMRAAQLGIAIDRLDVTVESQGDNRGLLGLDDRVSAALVGLRSVVHIRAGDATRDQLEALVRWADAHSPVACTLRSALAANIEVVVE